MEKTHLHPTPAESKDLTLRKQVNKPLWNTNWHPPLGRALCAQCGDIRAFHLSRHATLLPRGQEAGTALQKERLVKHSVMFTARSSSPHYRPTLPPRNSQALSYPPPWLTSDVSEGGERVPNSGLVKFSQNLGLEQKHLLK